MPVREAKSRALSREYMADRDWMTANNPAEREWYMLTALFADDAGYLPWDLPDNAANLYRYDLPDEREARVAEYVAHYAARGRFVVLGCGHARMPGVAKHPRGMKREFSVQAEHAECTSSAVAEHPSALLSYPYLSSPIRTVPPSALPVHSTQPAAGDPDGPRPAASHESTPGAPRVHTGPQPAGEVLSEFRRLVPWPPAPTQAPDAMPGHAPDLDATPDHANGTNGAAGTPRPATKPGDQALRDELRQGARAMGLEGGRGDITIARAAYDRAWDGRDPDPFGTAMDVLAEKRHLPLGEVEA